MLLQIQIPLFCTLSTPDGEENRLDFVPNS